MRQAVFRKERPFTERQLCSVLETLMEMPEFTDKKRRGQLSLRIFSLLKNIFFCIQINNYIFNSNLGLFLLGETV